MKTVHQLFHEFQQLKKPSDRDYMKLGHDLAKSIVVTPKNQHDLLWKFVKDKFPAYKSELIMYGATFYSELDAATDIVANKNEVLTPIFTKIETEKEQLPVEPKNKVEVKRKEEIPIVPTQVIKNVEKLDPHKEKMAQKVNEIRESVEKLDTKLATLKEIKDPGFSMKMAIDALEKFRDQMNQKHNPKKPK